MPNAKDYHKSAAPKFLALGDTGGGKTSGFLTLPGKKFAYLFDPNAIETLRGFDVDYEEFLPDDLSLKLTSLSKDTQKKLTKNQKPDASSGAQLYWDWEKEFEDKLASGFFDSYDAIMIDSYTTLSDMVMDGILAINGRPGTWPNQDDYGPQMLTITNISRTLASMGKTIYCTGHIETVKDDVLGSIITQPMLTGRLRKKLPLLFSEILLFDAMTDAKGQTKYTVQTRPDRRAKTIRCTLTGSNLHEDVTIDWDRDPVGQGVGGLYKDKLKGSTKPEEVAA